MKKTQTRCEYTRSTSLLWQLGFYEWKVRWMYSWNSDLLANKLNVILQQCFECMYIVICSYSKPFCTQTYLTQLCLLIIISILLLVLKHLTLRTYSREDENVNVDDWKSRNQPSMILRMPARLRLVVHMSFRTPFRDFWHCAVNVSIFCNVLTSFVSFPRAVCGFLKTFGFLKDFRRTKTCFCELRWK